MQNTWSIFEALRISALNTKKRRALAQNIEINQKSDSRENLSPFFQCARPKIRHQYAILTPSSQVPPALLIFKRQSAGYKSWPFAEVLYLYMKKRTVKTARGTCQDGVLMPQDGEDEMREDIKQSKIKQPIMDPFNENRNACW